MNLFLGGLGQRDLADGVRREQPQVEMRKQLLVEVNLALIGRLPAEQSSEPTTPLARQLAASIRLAQQSTRA
jgi:hypothetical protein